MGNDPRGLPKENALKTLVELNGISNLGLLSYEEAGKSWSEGDYQLIVVSTHRKIEMIHAIFEKAASEKLIVKSKPKPDESEGDIWSGPQSPQEWRHLLGISQSTLTRRVNDGTYRIKKVSTKSWFFHRDDLPR